jgi:uncharacterized membrane protein YGL010W
MANISESMSPYNHEQTNTWNKLPHGIGIPVLVTGLAVLLPIVFWKPGLALFVAGWVMLLAGHRIEGNHPALFQGPVYFLVGPMWVAKELKDALLGRRTRRT